MENNKIRLATLCSGSGNNTDQFTAMVYEDTD